jgi:RNA polymerase-interacting CarD/CdnL/TRCF family regulator
MRQSFCKTGASSFSQRDLKEVLMIFHEGDSVMHCTYGLGKIIRTEERTIYGPTMLYYAVQIGDMTVWVPADDRLETRLRAPTRGGEFQRLLDILAGPGEPLPNDRHERKELLSEWLKDGRAESLCRVIRSLATYRQVRSLSDNDQSLMKRTQQALIGEWGYSLSIPTAQAEHEMHLLLMPNPGVQKGKP